MKSLPKSVWVGGLEVPVLREEIAPEHEMFGFFQTTQEGAAICVDSRLTGYRELAVFLHELVHAIDETAGMGLKHRQVAGLGELLAQSLAPYLKF